MKVSLLTIGTEITTGEILNTNSQWISERLENLNMDVIHHVTVPDQREIMLSALDFISSSDILILTGGLGPTQDDITREVVAGWISKPLEFSDPAWEFLSECIAKRGRKPLEAHKRQCQFPKGAELLKNTVGTALGFHIEGRGKEIFVLPGPPRELKPMWENEVEPKLPKGSLTPWVKWTFEGLPESEVADRFERVLSGFIDPQSIEIGYRASPPIIHVKIREAHLPKGFKEKVSEEFGERLKVSP